MDGADASAARVARGRFVELVEIVRGYVDALDRIAWATPPTRCTRFHLTAGEAGAMARAASAERLMLTHLSPMVDPAVSVVEAEAQFGKAVELAVPGMDVAI